MKKTILFSILFFAVIHINGQITVGTNTLPDIGDVLLYTTFEDFEDTLSYKLNGEDQRWTYDNFNVTGSESEGYFDIDTSALRDSFPNANMLVNFGGFETAAFRSNNTIEIVGLQLGGFGGFGGFGGADGFDIDIQSNLEDPFLFRKTPLSYQDSYKDTLEFRATFPGDLIPGLDSLDLGFPGAGLDSIRVENTIIRTEAATAWGTISILGEEKEVLKLEETTVSNLVIELGVGFLGQIIWLDIATLGFDIGIGGDQTTVVYKFVGNEDKRSIVEFTENPILDTLGVLQSTNVTGRLSQEFLSSTIELANQKSNFILYPNPSVDFIRLKNPDQVQLDWACIVNSSGQIIKSYKPYFTDNNIITKDLPSGAYFLMYKNENRMESKLFYKN